VAVKQKPMKVRYYSLDKVAEAMRYLE